LLETIERHTNPLGLDVGFRIRGGCESASNVLCFGVEFYIDQANFAGVSLEQRCRGDELIDASFPIVLRKFGFPNRRQISLRVALNGQITKSRVLEDSGKMIFGRLVQLHWTRT
jgi:hypothetical protein